MRLIIEIYRNIKTFYRFRGGIFQRSFDVDVNAKRNSEIVYSLKEDIYEGSNSALRSYLFSVVMDEL